jgi:hypothetical protein
MKIRDLSMFRVVSFNLHLIMYLMWSLAMWILRSTEPLNGHHVLCLFLAPLLCLDAMAFFLIAIFLMENGAKFQDVVPLDAFLYIGAGISGAMTLAGTAKLALDFARQQ